MSNQQEEIKKRIIALTKDFEKRKAFVEKEMAALEKLCLELIDLNSKLDVQ